MTEQYRQRLLTAICFSYAFSVIASKEIEKSSDPELLDEASEQLKAALEALESEQS